MRRLLLLVGDAGSVHLQRWARAFVTQRYDVHVASFNPRSIDGVITHRLPKFGVGKFGYLLAIPVLRHLARTIRPDVVHAHYVTSYGFISAAAGLKPLLITAWGSDVLLAPRQSRLLKAFAKYAVSQAYQVATVAQHMNESVSSLGFPEARIVTAPFGVDTKMFRMAIADDNWTLVPTIVCTRMLEPIYDIPTLVRAFAMVRNRRIKFRGILVGEGSQREAIRRLIVELDLQAEVELQGWLPSQQLAQLLATCEIFVSPALSDGNNVSLNEAMASGCFPVATDIPANRNWLAHGVNGLMYPPGNAAMLAECLTQACARPDYARHARSVNRSLVEERANWHLCVETYSALYNDAIEESRSCRR